MAKFILPTTDWALLLPPILKDAQPGDVLEVHMQAMWQLTSEAVRQAGRDDLLVRLLDAPVSRVPVSG